MFLYDGIVYSSYHDAKWVCLRDHPTSNNISVFIKEVTEQEIKEHPEWVLAK